VTRAKLLRSLVLVVLALFVAAALLFPDAVYRGWRPIGQF
jgi:hypothetical protein